MIRVIFQPRKLKPYLSVLLLFMTIVVCQNLFAENAKAITGYKGTYLDLEGNLINISSYKGQVVFINFWASWCAPCLFEIPIINQFKDKYGDKVRFIGISMSDMKREKVKVFAHKYKINYEVGIASKGLAEEFGVSAIPVTLIYKANGSLYKRYDGPQESKTFEAGIKAALTDP